MNTSIKLETKVKRLTEGEYFVEDAKGGLLAKTWREDVANQVSAALNGKDIDLLNGKAGEILNAQLDELAALRAELAASKEREAKLRNLLEQTHGELQRIAATGQKVDQGLLIEARRALESHE